MRVENTVVVVTGAGSGIGAAMARRFAAEDARRVVVVDRDADAAERVAAACGPAGRAACLDVTDADATEVLIDRIEARDGPIALYCANAGVGVPEGPYPSDEVWQRLWAVHVMAHVHAARALVPRMKPRGGGWLLFTASAAGLLSQPDAPYAVTKHAALAHAEWLAIAHGADGIGVSCLCPGIIDTPMLQAETAERRAAMSAGQSLMTPDELALAVVEGLADERFLILTHPQVAHWEAARVADRARWIRGMQRAWADSSSD
ncbi:MAG: SDR family oxidoreductase [Burkholderiaceae bacterium]|nr:SDR family oxidoreductase [Burkholderiaceae bacterium]